MQRWDFNEVFGIPYRNSFKNILKFKVYQQK